MICYYPELCKGVTQCYTCRIYTEGRLPPEHPMPAVIIRVGWHPEHPMQMYPSAYWWITSPTMLWSCFARYGLVVERR